MALAAVFRIRGKGETDPALSRVYVVHLPGGFALSSGCMVSAMIYGLRHSPAGGAACRRYATACPQRLSKRLDFLYIRSEA